MAVLLGICWVDKTKAVTTPYVRVSVYTNVLLESWKNPFCLVSIFRLHEAVSSCGQDFAGHVSLSRALSTALHFAPHGTIVVTTWAFTRPNSLDGLSLFDYHRDLSLTGVPFFPALFGSRVSSFLTCFFICHLALLRNIHRSSRHPWPRSLCLSRSPE